MRRVMLLEEGPELLAGVAQRSGVDSEFLEIVQAVDEIGVSLVDPDALVVALVFGEEREKLLQVDAFQDLERGALVGRDRVEQPVRGLMAQRLLIDILAGRPDDVEAARL